MQQSMSVIHEKHLLDPRFLTFPPVADAADSQEPEKRL